MTQIKGDEDELPAVVTVLGKIVGLNASYGPLLERTCWIKIDFGRHGIATMDCIFPGPLNIFFEAAAAQEQHWFSLRWSRANRDNKGPWQFHDGSIIDIVKADQQ